MDLDVEVVVVAGVEGICFLLSSLDPPFSDEGEAVEEDKATGDEASDKKSEGQIERDNVQSGGLKMTSVVNHLLYIKLNCLKSLVD